MGLPPCVRPKKTGTLHSIFKRHIQITAFLTIIHCLVFLLVTLTFGANIVSAQSLNAPLAAPQQGLQGEYFNNTDLEQPLVLSRIDSTVDFIWVYDSPSVEVPPDNFSARWTGQVQAQYTETYSFYTLSDDGVRLWVDGELLIDNWTIHGTEEDTGSILLEAGEWYDIRLEYFEGGGEARMSLEWNSPSTDRGVIPAERLRLPDYSTSNISLSTPSATADGTSPIEVQVEMLDELGVSISDLPIWVQISGEFNQVNGSDVLSSEWVFIGSTDTAGQVSGTLTSTRAEVKWVTVKAGDIVLLPALQATFSAGEAVSIQLLLPGEQPSPEDEGGVVGSPDPIAIGQSVQVHLRAVDANSNLVTSYGGDVAIETSDPAATFPPTFPLENGEQIIIITWNTPGEQSLSATAISDPNLTGVRPIEVLSMRIPGLQGRYFNNPNLDPPISAIRYDPVVDFFWEGSPIDEVSIDNFSVRWRGQVEPQYAEIYTFYATADDGVRLWIDDQLLIDAWIDQGPTEYSAQLALEAGVPVDVRMEYYDRGYSGTARLEWESPSTPRQVIPTENLTYLELSGSSLSFDPPLVPADGTATTTVSVELLNAAGTPLADAPVAIQVPDYEVVIDGTVVAAGEWHPIGISDASGQVTAELASSVAGTIEIFVRAEGQILDASSSVEFFAGEPSGLLLLFPGETFTPGEAPGKMGVPETIQVDTVVNVTVLAVDDYWNQTTSLDDLIFIETPEGSADHPGFVEMVEGAAAFTIIWNETGLQPLTVRYPPIPSMVTTEEIDIQSRPVLTIGDGETLFVDEARYPMPVALDPGVASIPYDSTAGFNIGDEILILNVWGEGIGDHELRRIQGITSDELLLDAQLQHSYGGSSTKTIVQKIPQYGDVVVQEGGTISAHPWQGGIGGIVMFKAYNLTVEAGGVIDASELGFSALEGPGSGGFAAGGGFGGYGGDDSGGGIGGIGYGYAAEPIYLGSAGGDASASENTGDDSGGPGGGIVRLQILDTFNLDGTVKSNGAYRYTFGYSPETMGGGGAGGSIWIEAGTFIGTGQVTASGGGSYQIVTFEDPTIDHGGGSGGRVALEVGTNAFSGTFNIRGSTSGAGPGTLHILDTATGSTHLRVDNFNLSTKPALLTASEQTTWSFDTIDLIRGGDVEILNEFDGITLSPSNMSGDGTGQLKIHFDYEFPYNNLQGFGFYIPEGVNLLVPSDLTVLGTELTIHGLLSGLADLHLAPDGDADSILTLGAQGASFGYPTGTYNLNSVLVEPDQTLAVEGNPLSGLGVTLQTSFVEVQSGGHISADGLGYQPEGPWGPGSSGHYGCAGHGGYGGDELGCEPYGDAIEPITLGSAARTAGGGALHLIADELIMDDGVISANGATVGTSRNSGAGGSIWLEVSNMSGTGTIQANGGLYGGGGGRISINADTTASAIRIEAAGGAEGNGGGPGTIVDDELGFESRVLIIDNLGTDGSKAGLTDPGSTVWDFDRIVLINEGNLELIDPDDSLPLTTTEIIGDATAQITLHGSVTYTPTELDSFGLVVAPDGDLTLSSDLTLLGTELSVEGELIGAERLTVASGSGHAGRLSLSATGHHAGQDPGKYVFETLLLEQGQLMDIIGDSDTGTGVMVSADQMAVSYEAVVNADGYGYPSHTGPGAAGAAGHGGYGGGPSSGVAYGSVFEPTELGSGAGGAGGGALHLIANELQVDGSISADGLRDGGSGGSIWLETGRFSGFGMISANGGSSLHYSYGGGAGGRIAIYFDQNDFIGTIEAHSFSNQYGESPGGPGTIYLYSRVADIERLVVDNAGRDGRQAVLIDADTNVWDFDEISLLAEGDIELGDPEDAILLSPENMSGDGSAQLYLSEDFNIEFEELHGFGLHMASDTTLTLPQDFQIKGVPLTVLGALAGVDTLTLSPDVSSIADVYFGPQASSAGFEPRYFSFSDLTIQTGARLELSGDPASGSGAVLDVGDLTVGGHLSADGLGYTYQVNGPGVPGDFSGGAGHGGAGGDPLGGSTYGSLTEPETLGSAGYSEYHGAGGGAVEIIASTTVTVANSGRISADAEELNQGSENGAGGSIWIKANAVVGGGTISAQGGRGSWDGDGGGGGGRIAVTAGQVDPALTFNVESRSPGSGKPGTVFFGGIDPLQSTIEVSPATVPTDGVSTATVTVTLRDGGGNPIPDEPVELGLNTGAPTFIGGELVLIGTFVDIGLTDVNGQAIASLSAEQSGERILQARSGQVLLTQTATVEFVPGPVDPTKSTIWGTPTVAPADGSTPVSVWVKALDSFDNPIPGLGVELFASGNADVTQPVDLTAANGITSGSLVDEFIETVTVSAEINGVPIDDNFNVEFTGADLELRLTGPSVTAPGATVTYQLDLRNSGEQTADGIRLVQTLPPEAVYEFQNSPVEPAVEPTVEGDQLTWVLGDFDVGERLLFNVGVSVPGGTPFGTILETSATASTTAIEPDLANNSAVHSMEVVNGNKHSISLVDSLKMIGIGGEGTFKIIIENTGLLGDRFTIGLSGLDQDWYTIEPAEVALSPGGFAEALLKVQATDCGLDGDYPFTVQVTSAATGGIETVAGTLILQTAPVISALQPDNGLDLGSRNVSFAWHSDAPSEGTLTIWPFGDQTSKQIFNTEEGTEHSLVVEGLERDTTYVWQVQASSVCGVSASPERQFTVTNGVVFSDHSIDVTINRDYDQRFSVNIVNTDVVAHTVKLDVLNPYEDLILNFIGLGSRDEWITLLPGEASTVQLAIHAQDADLRSYQLTAVVQSDELGDPIRDTATLDIRVLFDADFTIEEVSRDPVSEEVTYRVVNRGTTLTDLSIKAVDPVTGDPAQVFLSPAISHALLGTDDSLEFTVFPLFGPEDVGEPQASAGVNGLMSVLREQGAVNFDLLVEAGGAIRNFVGTIDCWASGKQVYPLALDQVVLTCSGGDWYCTNRPDIEIPFPMPWFARPETILRSSLAASFRPSQEALPHTVNLKFNSRSIGSPSDPIPTGTYRFSVPASAFKGTFEAGTIEQTLSLHSDHPNNAHYTVATGFKLQASLEGAMMYVCASSPEEVSQAASGVCDMSALASDMSVAITWPKDETQIQPPANGLVNIQANIFDDVDPFVDQYEVEATVEYLDPSAEGIEDETILLFNDGLSEHKDLQAGDRFYNAMWKPQAGGSVRITVSAIGLAPGLEDSDSITIDLNVLPDFSVERVWQNEVSLFNQKAQVHAEVKNNGFPVSGPVEIEFCYFDIDEDTGDPIGSAIACSRFDALPEGETLLGEETIEVVDEEFIAPRLGLYYVEVTVDPE